MGIVVSFSMSLVRGHSTEAWGAAASPVIAPGISVLNWRGIEDMRKVMFLRPGNDGYRELSPSGSSLLILTVGAMIASQLRQSGGVMTTQKPGLAGFNDDALGCKRATSLSSQMVPLL
jgi:hypothetical protein